MTEGIENQAAFEEKLEKAKRASTDNTERPLDGRFVVVGIPKGTSNPNILAEMTPAEVIASGNVSALVRAALRCPSMTAVELAELCYTLTETVVDWPGIDYEADDDADAEAFDGTLFECIGYRYANGDLVAPISRDARRIDEGAAKVEIDEWGNVDLEIGDTVISLYAERGLIHLSVEDWSALDRKVSPTKLCNGDLTPETARQIVTTLTTALANEAKTSNAH